MSKTGGARGLARGWGGVLAGTGLLAVVACDAQVEPTCMVEGLTRRASGTGDYLAAEPRATDAGSGSASCAVTGPVDLRVDVHGFDPLLRSHCAVVDGRFDIELAPACRIEANVSSRVYDSSYAATVRFIQAEARILPGRECAIELGGSRSVRGVVSGGTARFLPGSVALFVTVDGTWTDADTEGAGTFQVRLDAPWIELPPK